MRSSYIENNYNEVIKSWILGLKPAGQYVELGVLDGYSTLAIAQAIEQLNKMFGGWGCTFDAYDLFEDYQYKHGSKEEVEKLLADNNVSQYANIIKGDAYKVYEKYPDRSEANGIRGIEFLHIDISNTGKVIDEIIELWHPKIAWRGIVMIEGGSEERDNVEWMKKYNAPSIKQSIAKNHIINNFYQQGCYYKYPSMTVLFREWWH